MNKLGQIVDKMLRSPKMKKRYQQALVLESWEQIAGREVASVSRALEIREGRLWVSVKDSTWAYHLSLFKPQLIKKTNSFSNSKVINDIFFMVGESEEKGSISNKTNYTDRETDEGDYHLPYRNWQNKMNTAYISEIKRKLEAIKITGEE